MKFKTYGTLLMTMFGSKTDQNSLKINDFLYYFVFKYSFVWIYLIFCLDFKITSKIKNKRHKIWTFLNQKPYFSQFFQKIQM